jgi:hypothetical protein
MHGVSAARRFSSAAVCLARRFVDDFPNDVRPPPVADRLPPLKRTVGVKRLTGWLCASSAEIASSETARSGSSAHARRWRMAGGR